jgi:hypothetical protein
LPARSEHIFTPSKIIENLSANQEQAFQILPSRVWTGGQWVQWQTRPLHVQGNPLHLRKFPLHFQTYFTKYVLCSLQQFSFQKFFWKIFKKKFRSLAEFRKTLKIVYFVQKRLQTSAHNVLEYRTKVKSCFCMVKCAKIRQFSFAVGFAGTPSLAVGLFYICILQGAS